MADRELERVPGNELSTYRIFASTLRDQATEPEKKNLIRLALGSAPVAVITICVLRGRGMANARPAIPSGTAGLFF